MHPNSLIQGMLLSVYICSCTKLNLACNACSSPTYPTAPMRVESQLKLTEHTAQSKEPPAAAKERKANYPCRGNIYI